MGNTKKKNHSWTKLLKTLLFFSQWISKRREICLISFEEIENYRLPLRVIFRFFRVVRRFIEGFMVFLRCFRVKRGWQMESLVKKKSPLIFWPLVWWSNSRQQTNYRLLLFSKNKNIGRMIGRLPLLFFLNRPRYAGLGWKASALRLFFRGPGVQGHLV
jgi:hypothetical protein